MGEITQVLLNIDSGDPAATEALLPLVYTELRRLAAARLAHERPGQTLQATALVHEAYLRLADVAKPQNWNSRRHFFAAAAEAMRRILVERARRRTRLRHGGEFERVQIEPDGIATVHSETELLALDEALELLAAEDPLSANLVKLRFFAGLTNDEAAELLGISSRKADFVWAYARAWLRREIADE